MSGSLDAVPCAADGRRRAPRRLVALCVGAVLAGCATVNEAPVVDLTVAPPARPLAAPTATPVATAAGEHIVARGDTLYGIAFRHGVDYRALADWNRIPPPYTIRVGQALRLTAPAAAAVTGAAAAARPTAPTGTGIGDTDTVALGSPDWRDDVPPPGEARTFGLDDDGDRATPASTLVDTAPAPVAAPAGTVRSTATGSAVAPDPSSTNLRPAADGPMPPPMTASAATPPRTAATPPLPAASPSPASASVPSQAPAPPRDVAAGAAPAPRPSGALARAVGVEPARPPPPSLPPAASSSPAPGEESAGRRALDTARIADAPTRAVGGVRWRWPADGTLVGRFAPGDPARQGIDLRGRDGAPVVAAADGEVVYSGNGLVGYGELVIIKHSAEFLSAYGHNRRRLVAEGERVRAGQPIAEMGRAPNGFDALHFEIRRAGRPTDPLQFLPPR